MQIILSPHGWHWSRPSIAPTTHCHRSSSIWAPKTIPPSPIDLHSMSEYLPGCFWFMLHLWLDVGSHLFSAFGVLSQTPLLALLSSCEPVGWTSHPFVQKFSALSDLYIEIPVMKQLVALTAIGCLRTGRVWLEVGLQHRISYPLGLNWHSMEFRSLLPFIDRTHNKINVNK